MILRSIMTLLLAVALALTAAANPTSPTTPTFIRGDLAIKYATRTQRDGDQPKLGVVDTYTYRVTVSNSAMFRGTIQHRPFVKRTFGSNQDGQLLHDVLLDVVNPANPSQTRNVGKLYGTVPVDEQNVYRFQDGNLKVSIFDMGAAKGFDSAAKGLAVGKPPAQNGLFSKIKKEAVKIQKQVRGQTVAITVTDYDEMTFQAHVLAAGPVRIYPEATVNGKLIYDYGRSAWHFQGLTITYSDAGRLMTDTLSGSIRWVEAPNRKTTGEGTYEFDVRVNEPAATEASIFAAAADESAFFAADTSIPSLTGTMRYKDSIVNDVVTGSAVQIDLAGNGLSKAAVMNLAKLLLFSFVVPLNAE